MARDLFIDLTNNRLATSETNLAPAGTVRLTKGDNGTFNLYFLQATGVVNAPFVVVDKATTSVKFGVGSRTATPETGTYTLTFGGNTTTALDAAVTAGQVQTALNALTAISSAGGVTVTGELAEHFTVRFVTAGTRGSITADVSQLIPDTVAVIGERVVGSASAKEVQEIQLRLTPAVYQSTWTNLSTAVTATLATTVTGSATNNEVQRLSFSQKPFSGTYRLTTPSSSIAIGSLVTAGVFIAPANHGLAINQPVTLTGFSALTGYSNGTQYFVQSIPQSTQFTVSVTAGGTSLTGTATTGSVVTTLRQTAPLAASATAEDIATALAALDSIGAGGVTVSGIEGEYYDITFAGNKALADLPVMTIQSGLAAKPGKTADVNFATYALRDLVGNSTSVDLDLEIELTDGGTRQTVILSSCSVSEELIDADAFSPVPQFSLPINSVAVTAYTLALSDAYGLINATTGMTITVPPNSTVPFPTGSQVLLYRSAVSGVAITAGAGVTINAAGAASNLSSQHSVASLMKLGTDSWVLGGDVS
jgi:hypothetical protein